MKRVKGHFNGGVRPPGSGFQFSLRFVLALNAPASPHAFKHLVGLSFTPPMFLDGGNGPRADSAVYVRVGMGTAPFLFGSGRKAPLARGADAKNKDIRTVP